MGESQLGAKRWLARGRCRFAGIAVSLPLMVGGGAVGAIAPLFTIASPAFAAQLINWSFDPSTQELRVQVPGGTSPNYFILAQPPRIVLDLPNTQVGNVPEVQTYAGAVRQIRVGQFQPGLTRIVIELDPDVVFAAEQVQLQPAANAPQGEQWVLRPLLVGSSASPSPPTASRPPAPPPPPPPTATVQPPDEPAAAPDEEADEPSDEPPIASAPPAPSELPDSEPAADPEAAADLPPLEPGALEIPIDIPPSLPDVETAREDPAEAEPPAADPSAPVVAAADGSGAEPAAGEAPQPAPAELDLNDEDEPQATASIELEPDEVEPGEEEAGDRPPEPTVSRPPAAPPPVNPPVARPETTAVAPSPPSTPPAPPPRPEPLPPPAEPEVEVDEETLSLLPPATLPGDRSVRVEVPSLETAIAASVASTSQIAVQVPVIEFGQPLVGLASPPTVVPTPDIVVASRRNALIPEGTVLSLRYPREEALRLNTGSSRQDVLVLIRTVRDRDGEIIAPAGTQVIGRFEATAEGVRFISQALALAERNVPMVGQSVEGVAIVQPNQQIDLRLTESVRSP
ncbi:MAG: AMIN domain-containing protein [Synechococcales bacterium]|nr:AMIN domain-containing protein [Synechococcales bacterium]